MGVTSSTIDIKAIQNNGTLAKEATKISIIEGMTVDQFINKVNTSNAGVTAIFENGRFSFTAKNTGDVTNGEEIELVGADALGFSAADFANPDISKKLVQQRDKMLFSQLMVSKRNVHPTPSPFLVITLH